MIISERAYFSFIGMVKNYMDIFQKTNPNQYRTSLSPHLQRVFDLTPDEFKSSICDIRILNSNMDIVFSGNNLINKYRIFKKKCRDIYKNTVRNQFIYDIISLLFFKKNMSLKKLYKIFNIISRIKNNTERKNIFDIFKLINVYNILKHKQFNIDIIEDDFYELRNHETVINFFYLNKITDESLRNTIFSYLTDDIRKSELIRIFKPNIELNMTQATQINSENNTLYSNKNIKKKINIMNITKPITEEIKNGEVIMPPPPPSGRE